MNVVQMTAQCYAAASVEARNFIQEALPKSRNRIQETDPEIQEAPRGTGAPSQKHEQKIEETRETIQETARQIQKRTGGGFCFESL